MSDSVRKNLVLKDTGFMKKLYWRLVRRVWKNKLSNSISNDSIDELTLPHNNTIVNHYDYCDWIYRCSKTPDGLCNWCEDSGYCKMKNK